jgi:hypothetical protein
MILKVFSPKNEEKMANLTQITAIRQKKNSTKSGKKIENSCYNIDPLNPVIT